VFHFSFYLATTEAALDFIGAGNCKVRLYSQFRNFLQMIQISCNYFPAFVEESDAISSVLMIIIPPTNKVLGVTLD